MCNSVVLGFSWTYKCEDCISHHLSMSKEESSFTRVSNSTTEKEKFLLNSNHNIVFLLKLNQAKIYWDIFTTFMIYPQSTFSEKVEFLVGPMLLDL